MKRLACLYLPIRVQTIRLIVCQRMTPPPLPAVKADFCFRLTIARVSPTRWCLVGQVAYGLLARTMLRTVRIRRNEIPSMVADSLSGIVLCRVDTRFAAISTRYCPRSQAPTVALNLARSDVEVALQGVKGQIAFSSPGVQYRPR